MGREEKSADVFASLMLGLPTHVIGEAARISSGREHIRTRTIDVWKDTVHEVCNNISAKVLGVIDDDDLQEQEETDLQSENETMLRAYLHEGIKRNKGVKFTKEIDERISRLDKEMDEMEFTEVVATVKEIQDAIEKYLFWLNKTQNIGKNFGANHSSFLFVLKQFLSLAALSSTESGDYSALEDFASSHFGNSILFTARHKRSSVKDILGKILNETLSTSPSLFFPRPKIEGSLPRTRHYTIPAIKKFFSGPKEMYREHGLMNAALSTGFEIALLPAHILFYLNLFLVDISDHLKIGFVPNILMLMVFSPGIVRKLIFDEKIFAQHEKNCREIQTQFNNMLIDALGLEGEMAALAQKGSACRAIAQCRKHHFPTPEIGTLELIDQGKPNIFIDTTAEDALALAREIDRQGGVNVLIELGDDNKEVLLYKDGKIYFIEQAGALVPDVEIEPWLSISKEEEARNKETESPVKGSTLLVSENKEVANEMMRRRGIPMPAGVAWRGKARDLEYDKIAESLDLKFLKSKELPDIEGEVAAFMRLYECDTVVVKPTDEQCGSNVEFFSDSKDAARHIRRLQRAGHNVLLEKRIPSAPIVIDGQRKDWNLRVFVSRDEQDNYVVSDIVARIDNDGKPVNLSISANAMTFDQTVEHLGLSAEDTAELRSKVEKMSIAAVEAIDKGTRDILKFPLQDKQYFAGIDVIVTEKLEPYCIEYNDHHSGGMWDLDNILPEDQRGSATRHYAALLIRKAMQHFKK